MNSNDFIIRIPLITYLAIEDPTKRGVFLAVYSFSDNGYKTVYASQRAIAKRSGYSRQTVQHYLNELVDDGLLNVAGHQPVRGGDVTIYRIVADSQPEVDKVARNFTTMRVEVADGGHEVADTLTQKQLKETNINHRSATLKEEDILKLSKELDVFPNSVVKAESEYLEWHAAKRPGIKPAVVSGVRNWLRKGIASGQVRLTPEGALKKEGYPIWTT